MALRGWHGDFERHRKRPLLVAWASVVDASANADGDGDVGGDGGGQGCPSVQSPGWPSLSDRGLARKLRRVFLSAARLLEGKGQTRDAEALRRASVHGLRHTFGVRAVEAGVPLDVVQQSLGHASLSTTSIYVTAPLARRMRESARLAAMPLSAGESRVFAPRG